MKSNKVLLFFILLIFGNACVPGKKTSSSKGKDSTSKEGPSFQGSSSVPVDTCPPNISGEAEYCQIFRQKEGGANTPVDILWVIDNSSSMEDDQERLADNFEIFIDNFGNQDVDFKMAIITTDSAANRNLGRALDSVHLKLNRQGFVSQFQNQIKAGDTGSYIECGLSSSLGFLKANPSWPRANAFLVVVYVSDENDSSSMETSEMVCTTDQGERNEPDSTDEAISTTYFNSVVGYKSSESLFKAFSIVLSRTRLPSEPYFSDYNLMKGHRYLKVAQLSGGNSYDIIDDSFETIFRDFGIKIAELSSLFQLQYPAVQSTIEVFVNGVATHQSDWHYLQGQNAIRFDKSALPKAKSVIKIMYQTR